MNNSGRSVEKPPIFFKLIESGKLRYLLLRNVSHFWIRSSYSFFLELVSA